MKITNKTHWRTDHLRALIQRVAEQEFETGRLKGLRVEIVYRQKNWRRCGLATVGGKWMRLYLPREDVDKIDLAHTFAHELAHTRGVRHRQMTKNPLYSRVGNWRELYAWAEEMPLDKIEAKPRLKPDVQLKRYERVLTLKRQWETKLRRAQNALKKLKTRERYYVSVLTAAGKLPACTED